jgi:hypothetical protein
VLVVETARRLLAVLDLLNSAGVVGAHGWGAELGGAGTALRRLLWSTVLREVPERPCGGFEVQAARSARHPCYELAADLFVALEDYARDDPERNATLLADGALTPLDPPTRFELAVVVRLVEALDERLDTPWVMERTVVHAKRKELVRFSHPDGSEVKVFYNQAVLDPAERDGLVSRYFGGGRARPDFTLIVEQPGVQRRAVVGEVKLSDDTGYLIKGLEESLLYRWEYRQHLTGWPKAVQVVSRGSVPSVSVGDDVAVVGWDDWCPDALLGGVVGGLADAGSQNPDSLETGNKV